MALTCEIIMKIDDIFLLFENSEKYFKSYDEAYYNSKKPMQQKQVYYVFTPTMQKFKRVNEIENHAREYFKKTVDCDFYDIFRKTGYSQMKLFKEV